MDSPNVLTPQLPDQPLAPDIPGVPEKTSLPTQPVNEGVQSPQLEPMPYRTKSRLARNQSKLLFRQAVFLVGLTLFLLFILIRFGIPILIRLAAFFGDKGDSSDVPIEQTQALLPPTLQPLPEATNSAQLELGGFAQENQRVRVFLNANPLDDVVSGNDGSFSLPVTLRKGENRIWATVRTDDQESEQSPELMMVYDDESPQITLDSPQDGIEFTEDNVEVKGLVSEEVYLTIQGRLVNQDSDGSFTSSLTLQEGENIITVFAKDSAGNAATKEVKVIYSP